jgi:hypothetical protein
MGCEVIIDSGLDADALGIDKCTVGCFASLARLYSDQSIVSETLARPGTMPSRRSAVRISKRTAVSIDAARPPSLRSLCFKNSPCRRCLPPVRLGSP